MSIKQVVTPNNLNPAHFSLNVSTKTIDVIFPPSVELPTGVVTELMYSPEDKSLTFNIDDAPQRIDLSAMLTDIHVNGATIEGTVLTLTAADGGADVVVDLASLAGVVTYDTETVRFSGSGTADSPLSAQVIMPTLPEVPVFDVELQDAFGVPIAKAAASTSV